MKVGVLAVQGDFHAHLQALAALGCAAAEVRVPADLEGLDALILPGGESSTHLKLLNENGLRGTLAEFHRRGGALYGTCAGLILLARNVTHPPQESLGLIDVDVIRNGYGRQIDSFEADAVSEEMGFSATDPLRMVFIRAPRITRVGPGVKVLASCEGDAVAAREGRVLVTSFHPEMTADARVHRYFLEKVAVRRD